MTTESTIASLLEWGNTQLGIAVLTALILGVLKNIPNLLRGIVRRLHNAPDRILMRVFDAIDRTSSKSGGLL